MRLSWTHPSSGRILRDTCPADSATAFTRCLVSVVRRSAADADASSGQPAGRRRGAVPDSDRVVRVPSMRTHHTNDAGRRFGDGRFHRGRRHGRWLPPFVCRSSRIAWTWARWVTSTAGQASTPPTLRPVTTKRPEPIAAAHIAADRHGLSAFPRGWCPGCATPVPAPMTLFVGVVRMLLSRRPA